MRGSEDLFTLVDGDSMTRCRRPTWFCWPLVPLPWNLHCCASQRSRPTRLRRSRRGSFRFSGLIKAPYFTLPNLLTEEPLVPELIQWAARRGRCAEVCGLLDDPTTCGDQQRFAKLRSELALDADQRAADAVIELADLERAPCNHSYFDTDGPVAGVDEAGRGPLAGPVVAAAVILDPARRSRAG